MNSSGFTKTLLNKVFIQNVYLSGSRRYLRNRTSNVVKWYEKQSVSDFKQDSAVNRAPQNIQLPTSSNHKNVETHNINIKRETTPQQFLSRNVLEKEKSVSSEFIDVDEFDSSEFYESVEEAQQRRLDSKRKPRYRSVDDITCENQYEKLAEVVTPLWKISYTAQLMMKHKKNKELLKKIYNNLIELGSSSTRSRLKHNLCDLTFVRSSEFIDAYRNKDEYCIWDGVDGNPKTVGYFIGSPAHKVVCVSPQELITIRPSHKLVVQRFQEYIRASPLRVCKSFNDGDSGAVYRNLIVRSTAAGELMAIVRIHPKELSSEGLMEEMDRLRTFFGAGPGQDCQLSSLYFQACKHSRCTANESPFHLLSGTPYLNDYLLGAQFRISPEAFFQVNTPAAEVLYKTVLELAQPDPNTILLDVCSGTGTISTVFGPYVERCIGVEVVRQAVEDARHNAAVNNIRNASFLCGRAEQLLPGLADKFYNKNVVAVVNPDRGGLHPAVVSSLRECESIKRLVYVSCLPEGQAMKNMVNLCSEHKKKVFGPPFTPRLAVPVDLFPHTNHCELVILLER